MYFLIGKQGYLPLKSDLEKKKARKKCPAVIKNRLFIENSLSLGNKLRILHRNFEHLLVYSFTCLLVYLFTRLLVYYNINQPNKYLRFMKKIILSLSVVLGSALLVSCGGTGSSALLSNAGQVLLGGGQTATGGTTQQTTSALGGVLGSLLGDLLGTNTVSQANIQGTWNYVGPDCVFESENFLAKAGGEVVAQKVESQISGALSKIGVTAGKCSFTFNADNTYTANIGGRAISGQYTLDTANSTMTMTYLAGLGKLTPKVSLNAGKLSLLFESDKLLSLANTLTSLKGGNNALSSIVSSYQGMYIGLQMTK